MHPPRVIWGRFPDAAILAPEPETKRHRAYRAAKSGDPDAAAALVRELIDGEAIRSVRCLIHLADRRASPVLTSVHAYEGTGVNAIPEALATALGERLEVHVESSVVQVNIVAHTGADGYSRLARQAAFSGEVLAGSEYIMVDDFIGQGGTLANMRGWIETNGASVIGAAALTGKPYSAKLGPTTEQLDELRRKHGADLERWWLRRFGHAFDCLTQSEARYLARSPDVDTIRSRLAAVQQGGDWKGGCGGPR